MCVVFSPSRSLLLALGSFAMLACTAPRTYTYPSDAQQELSRVCGLIFLRQTNRFLVEDGKIYPVLRSGYRPSPLEEELTNLKDRVYLCGPLADKNLPCPAGLQHKGSECLR